eukprot:9140815-Pyramimonas_sp.AAC.1
MGAAGACERRHCGIQLGSLWGHEARERCAEIGTAGACERSHCGLRWSPLGTSHERLIVAQR